MSRTINPGSRLSVLRARDGRSAVIFRRGPNRHVLMIRWWLASDTFETGQWLNGRVYPERSDLSHDGELIVYFAGKWRGPHATWTAVSRPPYFTALALWPKGDTWGGGGRFITERLIALDHPPRQMALADGFTLGKHFRIEALDPVQHVGAHDWMCRQGWETVQAGKWGRDSFSPALIYGKASPKRGSGLRLSSWRTRFRFTGPLSPSFGSDVIDAAGAILRSFAEPDWIDWDPKGNLLAAVDGRLYRIADRTLTTETAAPLDGAEVIADFTDLKFAAVEAPPSAHRWP